MRHVGHNYSVPAAQVIKYFEVFCPCVFFCLFIISFIFTGKLSMLSYLKHSVHRLFIFCV